MALNYAPLLGPTPEGGANKGLASFSDALEAVLQRRAAMQRQQVEIQAQQQAAALVDQRQRELEANRLKQEQAQQARIAEHERATEQAEREKIDLTRQQRQAETMKAVPEMLARGQSAAVPSYLQAGGMTMRPKEVPEEMRQPIEAPASPSAGLPFAGIMDLPGAAAARGAEQVRQKQVEQLGNTGVIDFGGGRTSDIDMSQLGPEARAKLLQTQLAGLDASDPFVARAKAAIPVLAGGGAIKPGQEAEIYRDATRESAADARARMAADAARNRQNTEKPGQVKDDARADMQMLAGVLDVKKLQESRRQFDKMTAMGQAAADGKNAIAAQAFMGMYTKFAQGEVGVLNKSDIDTFWTNAGSPEERTQEAIEKILSGGLGEEKRKKALAAIGELRGVIQSKLDEAHDQAAVTMEPYGDLGDRYLRSIFGKGLPKHEKARATGKAKDLLDAGGF